MKRTEILEIVGVCLIVMALISGYGLYYTSAEYAKVTETRLNAESYITNFNISMNENESIFDVDILVDNSQSRKDIQIYMVELKLYGNQETINMPDQRYYLKAVTTTGGVNETTPAGEYKQLHVRFSVSNLKDPVLFNRLQSITADGTGFFILQGMVRYEISEPSELKDYMPVYYMGRVVING